MKDKKIKEALEIIEAREAVKETEDKLLGDLRKTIGLLGEIIEGSFLYYMRPDQIKPLIFETVEMRHRLCLDLISKFEEIHYKNKGMLELIKKRFGAID